MFKRIAVLGAGNGGKMMAAELSTAGWDVNLYEVPEFADNNLKKIKETGGIEVDITQASPDFKFPGGGKAGFNKITGKITTDIKEALSGVDLIMLPIPAFARERFIRDVAPFLRDGQTVIIWPGYFGALQCTKLLKELGVKKDIIICETESLIYACKSSDQTTEGGVDYILLKGSKRKLAISSYPSKKIEEVFDSLKKIYPAFQIARNVIQTTLNNSNLPIHPQSVLLNLYLVERKFFPYFEQIGGGLARGYSVTPGSARVMQAVDDEISKLAELFRVDHMPLWENLKMFYNCSGSNLYEVLLNNQAYQNALAPTSLKHRFITEDIPFGLIPIAHLGEIFGLNMNTIRAMCTIASVATGINFWETGLNPRDIGINDMSISNILDYIE